MKFLKQVLILCVVLVVSYFTSVYFGGVYNSILSLSTALPASGFLSFVGFPLSYIFFLSFLFTAFGDAGKYWWIGILLIPAAIFEIYFDAAHLYFPVLLALLGWLIGFGISKIFRFNLKTA